MNKITPRDIREITLLSIEEAEKVPQELRMLEENGYLCWWWLRSPGYDSRHAASVNRDSSVYYNGDHVGTVDICVRPALKTENLSFDLKKFEKAKMFGHTWTAVTKDLVLCDDSLGKMAFRKDYDTPNANNYEKSDIKAWLGDWLEGQPEMKDYRAELRALHARVEAMWRD